MSSSLELALTIALEEFDNILEQKLGSQDLDPDKIEVLEPASRALKRPRPEDLALSKDDLAQLEKLLNQRIPKKKV